jgi:carbonyl reductase 1
MSKIAVVTGSNRGIGHSIVKGLAKEFNGLVYLTGKFHTLESEKVIVHFDFRKRK